MNKKAGLEELVVGAIIIFIAVVAIGLFSTFYVVHAGERAILVTWGNPAAMPESEGLHLKMPFVQSIVRMDIKTQKYAIKASAASKDLQIVNAEIAVNYQLSENKVVEIYKTIGLDYQERVIQPVVQEVVKASTAEYTAEELITRRPEVKSKIDSSLREKMASKGIIIQEVMITNFDFSESFNNAIENKVTAEQNALAQKNKLEQVKYEAQQAIEKAKGEAEAIKLQSQTLAIYNNSNYIQMKAIEKWTGVMPLYVGGQMPFIMVGVSK